MPDPNEVAEQAYKDVQRAMTLVAPDAINKFINGEAKCYPNGEIEISDFYADFADGSIVRAPRIDIKLS